MSRPQRHARAHKYTAPAVAKLVACRYSILLRSLQGHVQSPGPQNGFLARLQQPVGKGASARPAATATAKPGRTSATEWGVKRQPGGSCGCESRLFGRRLAVENSGTGRAAHRRIGNTMPTKTSSGCKTRAAPPVRWRRRYIKNETVMALRRQAGLSPRRHDGLLRAVHLSPPRVLDEALYRLDFLHHVLCGDAGAHGGGGERRSEQIKRAPVAALSLGAWRAARHASACGWV